MDPLLAEELTRLQATLVRRGLTVATAESCTGGLLATWLTHHPGSSAVYRGGVSAYADAAKAALLDVDPALIERHGAVSAPVAEAMAEGIRARLGATVAVSITGIAGPEGGTPAKPVGTVYVGVAAPHAVRAEALRLAGDREAVRTGAARHALAALSAAAVEIKDWTPVGHGDTKGTP